MHKTIRTCLKVVLALYVVIRIAWLAEIAAADIFDAPGALYYFIRHTIYTLSWISIMVFFYCLLYEDNENSEITYNDQITTMKKASFWAMIFCAIKLIVTATYQIQLTITSRLLQACAITELIAWLLLTVFFFAFWRWKKQQESEALYEDE